VEGSNHGIISYIIPAFAWKDEENRENLSQDEEFCLVGYNAI
jgi:hypothetical protein